VIARLEHRGELIRLREVAAEVAPRDRRRCEHHVAKFSLRRTTPAKRIVHEAEAMLRSELAQEPDVLRDGSPIRVVLERDDQVQVIDTAPLPLCNTSERPDP
jgi:hypothetical protein